MVESRRNFSHSIMFHHFFDEQHPKGQGAISSKDFEDMIDWLSERYTLLDADEYQHQAENDCLLSSDICLSFDDALLCQYDIARPILRKKKMSVFFFVYSSCFSGELDYLEVFRYFRTVEYKSIDSFYSEFFTLIENVHPSDFDVAKAQYNPKEYLSDFPFYTENDKWFRYLRDVVLGVTRYYNLMISLIETKKFKINQIVSKLWMTDEHLINLKLEGHIVGLHSYSHPTMMHLLEAKEQEKEYRKNFKHLSEVVGEDIATMSHPCGNYNFDTLDILKRMGVKVGFRSNISVAEIKSSLEIPREDHANVFKEMIR